MRGEEVLCDGLFIVGRSLLCGWSSLELFRKKPLSALIFRVSMDEDVVFLLVFIHLMLMLLLRLMNQYPLAIKDIKFACVSSSCLRSLCDHFNRRNIEIYVSLWALWKIVKYLFLYSFSLGHIFFWWGQAPGKDIICGAPDFSPSLP